MVKISLLLEQSFSDIVSSAPRAHPGPDRSWRGTPGTGAQPPGPVSSAPRAHPGRAPPGPDHCRRGTPGTVPRVPGVESLARKCIWLILWQTHTPIVHFHDNFGWHFGGVGPVTIFQICIGVHYGDTRKPLGGPEKIQRHPTPHVAGGCDAEIPERRGQRFVRPRDLK